MWKQVLLLVLHEVRGQVELGQTGCRDPLLKLSLTRLTSVIGVKRVTRVTGLTGVTRGIGVTRATLIFGMFW